MVSRIIVLITGVMFLMLSGPVASQDWVDIKNPKELRALYSNKTFRGTWGGVPYVEHNRADGKGIFISAQLRAPYTWEVKGNDQVCISFQEGTDCFRFQRSKKNPDEYVRTRTQHGTRRATSSMEILKVEDGIPEF
ncbi:MAG: hypothetical protein H6Q53_1842 [Deltaproteobacteria bacterium]|nr:hypothetical protein [Deltaproteobacteria bacterium]